MESTGISCCSRCSGGYRQLLLHVSTVKLSVENALVHCATRGGLHSRRQQDYLCTNVLWSRVVCYCGIVPWLGSSSNKLLTCKVASDSRPLRLHHTRKRCCLRKFDGPKERVPGVHNISTGTQPNTMPLQRPAALLTATLLVRINCACYRYELEFLLP